MPRLEVRILMCLVGMILRKILFPRSWILRVRIGIRESEDFPNGGLFLRALAVLGPFCCRIEKYWSATPPVGGDNRWCRNGGQKVWCRRYFGVHVTSQKTTQVYVAKYIIYVCLLSLSIIPLSISLLQATVWFMLSFRYFNQWHYFPFTMGFIFLCRQYN